MSLDCNNCYWSGDVSELVRKTEETNDRSFDFCPVCGGDDFEEFEEDDEE